jgi:translation initiation factor 3 subunit B
MATMDLDFSNIIIVDNCPVVAQDRYEKLCGVLKKKIFKEYGNVVSVEMPTRKATVKGKEVIKTMGFAFVEYASRKGAMTALAKGDNKRLDAKHVLRVNAYEDFEHILSTTAEYQEPEKQEYLAKDDQSAHLIDPLYRDQFLVRSGMETEIFWNDPYRAARDDGRVMAWDGEDQTQGGKSWTEGYTSWSPKGHMLATFHAQGIALWGGERFARITKFGHGGVQVIQFSPDEGFLVTCNASRPKDPECIQVHDIRTGHKRAFAMGDSKRWPVFAWTPDDKYFVRVGENKIYIYQTPSFALLEKKAVPIKGVNDVQCSPSDNIISYAMPCRKDQPATVALMELPSRKVIRDRRVYNVERIDMHWQEQGDFLCVKLLKRKSKKKLITSFELFCMRGKEIPVLTLEIEEEVLAFAWEPNGTRFAVVHNSGGSRASVSIYNVNNLVIDKIVTLEDRACNCLFWSPTGNYLVMAGLGNTLNGALEFYDCDDQRSMKETEHFMCTDIEWDPAGTFLITSVCQPLNSSETWRFSMENGYKVFDFQGVLLSTVKSDALYQVMWRPRPKCQLTEKRQKKIKRQLKTKYWDKFQEEEEDIQLAMSSGLAKMRLRIRDEWRAFRARALKEYLAEKPARTELRDGMESDDERMYINVTEVEEQILSEKTEFIA